MVWEWFLCLFCAVTVVGLILLMVGIAIVFGLHMSLLVPEFYRMWKDR